VSLTAHAIPRCAPTPRAQYPQFDHGRLACSRAALWAAEPIDHPRPAVDAAAIRSSSGAADGDLQAFGTTSDRLEPSGLGQWGVTADTRRPGADKVADVGVETARRSNAGTRCVSADRSVWLIGRCGVRSSRPWPSPRSRFGFAPERDQGQSRDAHCCGSRPRFNLITDRFSGFKPLNDDATCDCRISDNK
jgi:hypothetical protein